jgi:hypothetical protein
MPTCREIFWFAGKQFVGKAPPNQVLEWTATVAITKSRRWTIMAGPVRIASLYDEEKLPDAKNYPLATTC